MIVVGVLAVIIILGAVAWAFCFCAGFFGAAAVATFRWWRTQYRIVKAQRAQRGA